MSKEQHVDQNEEKFEPLFGLGETVITPRALNYLGSREIPPVNLVLRHVSGDFGEMDPEDLESNRKAIEVGSRVFSSYQIEPDQKVWVITEWDRSVTTILLPSEY